MVWPFLTTILAGMVIAYIFLPVYDRLHKVIKSDVMSAVIVSLLVVLIFTAPFVLMVNALYKDTAKLLVFSKQKLSTSLFDVHCDTDTIGCKINNYFNNAFSDPKVKDAIYASLSKFTFNFLNSLPGIIASLPRLILNLFILIFVMFYTFKESDTIIREIRTLLPFKESFNEKLIVRTKNILHATVYGAIIVALVQGILGVIGLFIFGTTNSPFLWGALLAFAGLIPIVGTALVWFPLGMVQVITGLAVNNSTDAWKGIGFILYGALLISTIDNILKPKLIGRKSDLHPVVVLLGVVGGLAAMGVIGIIIGPLVFATLLSFIELYKDEKHKIVG